MKNQIKNLLETIQNNQHHHCEIFTTKDKEKVRVAVDQDYSIDGRGWCYQLTIKPTRPSFPGKPYSYYGGKNHIKNLLKQWLNEEKTLTHCGWAGYAHPAYMLAKNNR